MPKFAIQLLSMPLFYQHDINRGTKLGVWQIEETEDFFLEKVPLKKDVSHPHKRLQHLAGRYLLPFLFPDFPVGEIVIADTRKPFLQSETYHFSISHCGQFAAAIVSTERRVGIDVEYIRPRIQGISHKFLAEEESFFLKGLNNSRYLEFLTLIWSAKEAIYKWHGLGEIDFKENIQLGGAISFQENEFLELPFFFSKGGKIPLVVNAKIFDDLSLAWLA